MSAHPDEDRVRRFLLEGLPVRGQFVRLGQAWLALREHGAYPPPVRDLLGEAIAASVLLASTLKFEGTLTLQMQGDGAVGLLVAQCTDDFRVRGVARFDESRVAPQFTALVGAGRMTVTIETGESGAHYQGIVPLDGATLADCLDTYFASSEQLPTRVRLAADGTKVAGLLLQQLPGASGTSESRRDETQAAWARAEESIARIDAQDLLHAPTESLVTRASSVDDVRLFAGDPVAFQCRCSRERVLGILRALGEEEIREVLAEQGAVSVTCEFCHKPYDFDAVDIGQLFADPSHTPENPPHLH